MLEVRGLRAAYGEVEILRGLDIEVTAGEIVENGPTETIFSTPKHSYTQHLLAAEPTIASIVPNSRCRRPTMPQWARISSRRWR